MSDSALTTVLIAMLGGAALILSLAGGYTTWDGMQNFTGEPVLSLMFTFGIHGVMLIVAWLIGESFATGMNTVARQTPMGRFGPALVVITLLGGLLIFAGTLIYAATYGISSDNLQIGLFGAGALLLGLALVAVFAKADVVAPYIQATRIIAKNAVLWVMFLACMSTSVFFSFDSRISRDFQIHPKYAVRFTVSGFNLTNHFNPLDVRRNTADPQRGTFFGNYNRFFRLDFDVIF